ncbi:uncharacterized protein LOC143817874 [Ranitomeya variabilis]|uniref:uncharacterized protein LOC143817874 n=1 Tax=Ranitomeya variabilis TaxID=490064 RepID=UPI004056EF87
MASSVGSVSSTISTEDPSTASTELPGKSGETPWTKSAKISITERSEETQDQQGQCAWWCNELFGIISLAAAGTILFFTIILCIFSYCLWKKITCAKKESLISNNTDMKEREMDMLGPQAPLDGTILPFPDVGPSDAENCTVNAELSKKETPQEPEDQPTDEAPMINPPPEDIPMLP